MEIKTHEAATALQREINRLTRHLHMIQDYGKDAILFATKIDTDVNGQPIFLNTTVSAEKDCLPLDFGEILNMYKSRVRAKIAKLEAEFESL